MTDIASLAFLAEEEEVPVLDFLGTESLDVSLDDPPNEEAYVELSDGRLVPADVSERVAQCGQLRHKPDWRTGKRAGYYQRCELHLYCPSCLARRASKEKERVLAAVGDTGTVYKLVVSAGESTAKIVRGIDSAHYRRYPQANGSTVILHTDPNTEGDSIPVEDLDFQALARTPEGANWSGKLAPTTPPVSTENKDKEEGPSKVVRVPAFTVDDPRDRIEAERNEDYTQCWEFATLATADLDPGMETLALCMRERMRHYRSALEKKGYRVTFFVYDFERVYEAEIDWKPYNAHIRKKLQAQGYTNTILDPPGREKG